MERHLCRERIMKCPVCGFADSKVIDSRHIEEGNSIRRRRECLACQKRYTTFEIIETVQIIVTKKNGTKFLDIEDQLGSKASRGNIVIAHEASTDGGINADWIWDMTTENKKVKVLIFDDKARTDVPVSGK